jgi:hypothetical protein
MIGFPEVRVHTLDVVAETLNQHYNNLCNENCNAENEIWHGRSHTDPQFYGLNEDT